MDELVEHLREHLDVESTPLNTLTPLTPPPPRSISSPQTSTSHNIPSYSSRDQATHPLRVGGRLSGYPIDNDMNGDPTFTRNRFSDGYNKSQTRLPDTIRDSKVLKSEVDRLDDHERYRFVRHVSSSSLDTALGIHNSSENDRELRVSHRNLHKSLDSSRKSREFARTISWKNHAAESGELVQRKSPSMEFSASSSPGTSTPSSTNGSRRVNRTSSGLLKVPDATTGVSEEMSFGRFVQHMSHYKSNDNQADENSNDSKTTEATQWGASEKCRMFLRAADEVSLFCESYESISFGELRKEIEKKEQIDFDREHLISLLEDEELKLDDSTQDFILVVLPIGNLLSREALDHFNYAVPYLQKQFEGKAFSLLVVGSGPSKFIGSFCKKANISNGFSDLSDSKLDESANQSGMIKATVVTDLNRKIYALMSAFEATESQASRDGSLSESSRLASNFDTFSKIIEAPATGAKLQFMTYFSILLKSDIMYSFEMDLNQKFRIQ